MPCCPNCGSCRAQSNLKDERPYADAAREAPSLRFHGQMEAATFAMSELYAVRLQNFNRLDWHCLECGAKYDE